MAQNSKFYRNFIILNEDETGYAISKDKTISGYSKIQAKGDICKISFYVQNLKTDNQKYYMLLICNNKDGKVIINIGELKFNGSGKGETVKEWEADNIGGLGIGYDRILGTAVATIKDGIPAFVMCGFMNGKEPMDNWKKYKIIQAKDMKKNYSYDNINIIDKNESITTKAYNKNNENSNMNIDKTNINEKEPIEELIDDKYINYGTSKENNIPMTELQGNNSNMNSGMVGNTSSGMNSVMGGSSNSGMNSNMGTGMSGNASGGMNSNLDNYGNNTINQRPIYNNQTNDYISKDKEDYYDDEGYIEKNSRDRSNSENYIEKKMKEKMKKKMEEEIDVEKPEERKVLRRSISPRVFEEYESNIEENKISEEEFSIKGSIGEYFESIADGFKVYRDGIKDVKYCKWYKVEVKDLYQMCNMSNYNKYTVVYYPMLNYYPYIKSHGHFMLGYKCDKDGNLKYIVYGIPGKRDKDQQPYEGKTGFVTWVRDKENSDMGFWLMFYDYKNSTIVVPMQ